MLLFFQIVIVYVDGIVIITVSVMNLIENICYWNRSLKERKCRAKVVWHIKNKKTGLNVSHLFLPAFTRRFFTNVSWHVLSLCRVFPELRARSIFFGNEWVYEKIKEHVFHYFGGADVLKWKRYGCYHYKATATQ